MEKIIWTYWHQGEKGAPFIVKKCIKQMKVLNPKWKIVVLDKYSAKKHIKNIPIKKEKWALLPLPQKSDLIRNYLLINYGGVWIDSTVYLIKPLDTWLSKKMKNGLFLFYKPGPDRIISNWFIASEKNNTLLKKLQKSLINYWNSNNFRNLQNKDEKIALIAKRIINGRSFQLSQIWLSPIFTKILRVYPYMIYHFMFYRLIKKDTDCKKIWLKMPKVSAKNPHKLQQVGLLKKTNSKTKKLINKKEIPLFKLKWNIEKTSITDSCNLNYLFTCHNNGTRN